MPSKRRVVLILTEITVKTLSHTERDGVMSIIASRERLNSDPAALFKAVIAYSGSCRVDGRRETMPSAGLRQTQTMERLVDDQCP